jgi:hypothetical protein
MSKDAIRKEMTSAWRTYLQALEKAVDVLDGNITEARDMARGCTDEQCTATEHTIDELSNALFSISEHRWADPKGAKKLKLFKRRVYDL